MQAPTSLVSPTPRYVDQPALEVTGLSEEFTAATRHLIPVLWQRFAPRLGTIPEQVGTITYGVCIPSDRPTLQYMACVHTKTGTPPPNGMTTTVLPEGRYAVFTHTGSLDTLPDTVDYIFGVWAAESGEHAAGQPDFERYDDRFDPATGSGEMEYWVPVR